MFVELADRPLIIDDEICYVVSLSKISKGDVSKDLGSCHLGYISVKTSNNFHVCGLAGLQLVIDDEI